MKNTLELRKLRKQITDLIYKKQLNKYEQYKLDYFIDEYKKLDNDETPFIYIALAKHYLSIENIKLANENIKKAEEINPNLASILYLNYRINLKLKNFENAYNYLKMYEEKIKEKANIDLSIYYYLFNIILNQGINVTINNKEYINSIKITDSNLKIMLENLKENIVKEKYRIAKEEINKINNYCLNKNIFINLDELSLLIDEILLKKVQNKENIDDIICQIKSLIDDDILNQAKDKLDNIKHIFDYKSRKIQISLLKRYLKEKEEIQRLKESKLYDVYEEYINLGKLNFYYNDYYTAYQYFTAGYYLTEINEFKFYIARCLLFMGKNEEAINLFIEYNKEGYSKLLRSYRFLINNRHLSSKDRKKIKKEYYLLMAILEPEKKINKDYNDKDIKENFFFEDNITDDINTILNKFDEYSDIDKLKFIKYLYQKSYQKIADKLLKQYEQKFCKDKETNTQMIQLKKNRLLYIKQ